jgi:hypothetical protein
VDNDTLDETLDTLDAFDENNDAFDEKLIHLMIFLILFENNS